MERADYSLRAARATPIVQRNQPPGVPPLELTGERTLPDVPEENYWYRRHLVVYRWIAARCAGLRVVGHGLRRGLRLGRARGAGGARSWASTPTPRRTSTRACATRRRSCASSARWSRSSRTGAPWDAIVFLQTVEHVERAAAAAASASRRCWRPGGVAYVSTPNRLTLAAAGRRAVRQPVARARVHAGRVPRACSSRPSRGVDLLGVFHARKLRAHELALRLGWDRVHAALRLTRPFYDRFVPAIDERDFAAARRRARPRARPARRVPSMSSAAAADRGELAIVLHSPHALRRGLRHLAVRRGVAAGGDRLLLPAAAARARASGRARASRAWRPSA